MAEPYSIRYAAEALGDIRTLRAYDQKRVLDGIADHLSHEPRRISRSRIKEMIRPFWSQYRLRIDEFRAYYDVDDGQHTVYVLRVLKKTTEPTPGGLT
jgi:mRNA-degrading endonuclease RelE of RelBE toxin-antitoxin system